MGFGDARRLASFTHPQGGGAALGKAAKQPYQASCQLPKLFNLRAVRTTLTFDSLEEQLTLKTESKNKISKNSENPK